MGIMVKKGLLTGPDLALELFRLSEEDQCSLLYVVGRMHETGHEDMEAALRGEPRVGVVKISFHWPNFKGLCEYVDRIHLSYRSWSRFTCEHHGLNINTTAALVCGVKRKRFRAYLGGYENPEAGVLIRSILEEDPLMKAAFDEGMPVSQMRKLRRDRISK